MIKLARYLKPHWIAVLLAPLLMVLEVCMDLLQPKLMASIVDEGIIKGDLSHIKITGLYMLAAALVGLIGGVGCTVYSSIASQKFGADLRGDLFRKVQTFSFRNLDELKTGSLITRLTSDIVQLQTMVQMLLRIFVRSPMLAIGSIIMTIAISPKLALILAIVVPLLFIVMFALIRSTLPLFASMQSKLDAVNTVLQENFTGIRVAKAFVRSNYENERFGRANRDYTGSAIKAMQLVAINMPILTFILNAAIAAVLWYGGLDVQKGSLPVGDLIAFINYVTQVMMSLSMIGMMLVRHSTAKVSAQRVQEVLNTSSEIRSAESPAQHNSAAGEIAFEHVSFAYAGASASERAYELRDISFTAKPGQKLALIGATGAGKSTLVNLIPRLYEATQGRVFLDGIDVRDMELGSLRTHIGIVLQESILFTGTIREDAACHGGAGKALCKNGDAQPGDSPQAGSPMILLPALPKAMTRSLASAGSNFLAGRAAALDRSRAAPPAVGYSFWTAARSHGRGDGGADPQSLRAVMHGRTEHYDRAASAIFLRHRC